MYNNNIQWWNKFGIDDLMIIKQSNWSNNIEESLKECQIKKENKYKSQIKEENKYKSQINEME